MTRAGNAVAPALPRGHRLRPVRPAGGSGRVRMQQGFFTVERTCPSCSGAGQTIKDPCKACNGTGHAVQKEKTLKVTILRKD